MDFLRYIQMRFLSYHCDNFLRIYYHSVLKQLLDQAHQEKQISYQQDLPTNMNPSKPDLPGFFIKADCSDATTR
ncbi:hypothetical protein ACSLOS_00585, partial [Klebsiella pneumoniae]